jgi:hypothetical protein
MFRSLKFTLFAAPLLLAAGCTSDFGPWPMPTGYAYHHGEYHAPPGPEPVFRKWEKEHMNKGVDATSPAPPMNMDTHFADDTGGIPPMASIAPVADLQTWQNAADDLTRRLFSGFGRPNEMVYLQPVGGAPDSFGSALRSSLQSQNVKLADNVGGGPFALRYEAQDTGGERMLLTVSLMNGAMKLAEESGSYAVGVPAPVASVASPAPPETFVGGSVGAPMPITNDSAGFETSP